MKYVHAPVTVVSNIGGIALIKYEGSGGVVPVPSRFVIDSDDIPSEWKGYTIAGEQSSGHQNPDAEGEMRRRKRMGPVLQAVRAAGPHGMTSKEYRIRFQVHHGIASSAMSNLHKDGLVDQLEEKRDRYRVYVAPEFVSGRPTVERKR